MSEILNFSTVLPETLMFSVVGDAGNDPDSSYLDVTIQDDPNSENVFEGLTFDGYCIDTDRGINTNTNYTAQVYSSYDLHALEDAGLIGTGLIEFPENLDLVNWIINQEFEGKTARNGETFTSGDVQRAIWSLIDDQNSTGALGSFSDEKAQEILDLATANGEDFVPSFEDTSIFNEQVTGKLAVILISEGLNTQFVIIEVELSKLGHLNWRWFRRCDWHW